MRRRIVEPGQTSLPLVSPPEPVRPRPARQPAHHCHLPGCDVAVPPKLLMCRKHWAMVPSAIRRDVWRYFDPAQCSDQPNRPLPSESWHRAADAAIDAVLDALGDRVVKAVTAGPLSVTTLEDEPPGGMTVATLRRVLNRLLRVKRLRYDAENRLVPA